MAVTPSLVLACGCTVRFSETPLCATHGRQRVVRTSHVGPPRIRGVATGPHVVTMDLDPHVGQLAGSEKGE
jgi:hypothetical protein